MALNRARSIVLLALAVVVVVFVATWVTIPSGQEEVHNLTTGEWTSRVPYPAKLFRVGLRERDSPVPHPVGGPTRTSPLYVRLVVDLDALRSRVLVFYGGLAAVIVLVGAAFGAFRRREVAAP